MHAFTPIRWSHGLAFLFTHSVAVLIAGIVATMELLAIPAIAQEASPSNEPSKRLSVDRIYQDREFDARSIDARWLDASGENAAYTVLERSATYPKFQDIVSYDADSGEKTTLVTAEELIPPGESEPLSIDDYTWSNTRDRLLLYTQSRRVWRTHSRGDYWLLDRSSRQLRQLGHDAPPSSMMFAKFSPSGKQVAFVRQGNLYVQNLLDDTITPLTFSDSEHLIHGTTDWVYEEEFRLRDAYRWSPDGKQIAFWQIDDEGVQRFPLVNNTDSLYPTVTWIPYPKVGTQNPACRIGVVDLETKSITWMQLPGDPRDHYVPWIEWIPRDDALPSKGNPLLIEQLNRLQNTCHLFKADPASGKAEVLFTDRDDAWVDVYNPFNWVDSGKQFTWIGEHQGWRKIAFVDTRTGTSAWTPPGDFDVIELLHVDSSEKRMYFVASPDNATERYLYQVGFDGTSLKRLTPTDARGTHQYQLSPDVRYAIHTFSSADHPPVVQLISLPEHQTIRVLEDNADLVKKLAELPKVTTEFFPVEIEKGVKLDGWCMSPPSSSDSEKHPLLVYVYGEPAGTTVINQWGGQSYLWHRMLAERGWVVMSFDNRGTDVPRGREFRKSVYRRIGDLGPSDQAAALRRVLADRPDIDADRVGIWGWSGGGSSSLHAIFKYPEVYKFAVAVAPVPNMRYYDTIYQERYMGLPETNVEGYRIGSSINFANSLVGDLLIIHGTGDDNCHYQTVEMLIDELVAANKPFSMMAYPNRSHSIDERKNTTRHLRSLMLRFLEGQATGQLPRGPFDSVAPIAATAGDSGLLD